MKTYVKSPLNYVGGKYKLLPQIIPLFPEEICTFIDLFTGGANVAVNVKANKYIVNDLDKRVIDLLKYMYETDTNVMLRDIENYMKIYSLSRENKSGYLILREDYNNNVTKPQMMLYTLICHSFSNQIRFNLKGEFNMPFGERTFNDRLRSNFIRFTNTIKQQNIEFKTIDFRHFDFSGLQKNDFVYCDPPYLLGTATYNENGGWTEQDDKDLLKLLDGLNSKGIKFALSNIFENKGKKNNNIIEWSKKYNINYLNNSYSNCNYQSKDKGQNTTIEVLITNY